MKEYNGIKIDGDKVYLENGKIRKDRIGVNYLGIATEVDNYLLLINHLLMKQ